jgi:fatty acid-binding protein DegV
LSPISARNQTGEMEKQLEIVIIPMQIKIKKKSNDHKVTSKPKTFFLISKIKIITLNTAILTVAALILYAVTLANNKAPHL